MIELGIVGTKNSGKTTVLEGLVNYLIDNGFRVATIKHTSHSHRFDKQGKDSYRHREAGAEMTIAISKGETAVFASPNSLNIRQLQQITPQFDIWLVEGDRDAKRPKILVTRNLTELSGSIPENIIATIGSERIDNAVSHFEDKDYSGLGLFVSELIINKKSEVLD